jgi:hypothetical protein
MNNFALLNRRGCVTLTQKEQRKDETMEENKKNDALSPDGPQLIRGGLRERLENYWYHYKWHTIAAIFIIAVVLICTLQMCSKTEYDVQIMYATGKPVSRYSESGDMPDYNKIVSSLMNKTADFSGDGEVNVSFVDKYVLTPEQMAELEANLQPGEEIPYSLLMQNANDIGEMMVYGDFFLCFLSPEIYEQYRSKSEVDMFYNLREVGAGLDDSCFYSDSAIKLSSLEFYNESGISSMPEDTLICLRGTISALNTKDAKRQFAASLEVFKKIIETSLN